MNDERTRFALTCRDRAAPAPVLVGVQADGRLDAVLFNLALRQTYRNTGDRVLEVVYTIALPATAVLLGFASELNGQRQEAVVVARREAEQQYEESLQEGDAPVMLEAHANGLLTANVGNLMPGDELVLECRFAQILAFEQGRLRIAIPTTMAPRHGHAEQAGLQPQQVPAASLDVEYPLALTLTLGAALAGARLECPTHAFSTTGEANGATRMTLAPGARLDRDVVAIVTPREPRPSLRVSAADGFDPSAPVVVMAALQLPPAPARECIGLKLLVDCSGSMNGDSMVSARAALRGVVAGLGERDRVSLSRFGSSVQHLFAPSLARPQAIRHLMPLVDGMQADLGGTEMEAALAAVFELPCSAEHGPADVLLITDGEIWQADEMVAAARSSRHRVFAIGVGSAPAEGVLRALAESTGGACEFATPGEALEAAARRMLQRMRQPAFMNARVDWGTAPAWSSGPSRSLFGGDTAIALAGFSSPIQAHAVRLLADDPQGRTVELACSEADAPCPGDSLPRIAAAWRSAQAGDAEALALALRYQLMSRHTHCILVHRRAEADRATAPAELHRVSSMLAAGWAGLGSVTDPALSCSQEVCRVMAPSGMASRSAADLDFSMAGEAFAAPAFLRQAGIDPEPAPLEVLARRVADHLARGRRLQGLAARSEDPSLHADARRAINEVAGLGTSRDLAWLLLAHWINTRPKGLADAGIGALVQPRVDAIDASLVAAATQVFERRLGGYPIDGWTSSRMRRLRHALGRMGH